jgi:hypothetical protein
MSHFDAYRDSFPNAQLTRSKTGVLEVALHTKGGTLAFNGYTHEQFVDLFHAIGSDRDNRVVILTGSGNAFMETISPEGFDFFTPRSKRGLNGRSLSGPTPGRSASQFCVEFSKTKINIVCPWHGFEFEIRTWRHHGNPHFRLKPLKAKVEGADAIATLPEEKKRNRERRRNRSSKCVSRVATWSVDPISSLASPEVCGPRHGTIDVPGRCVRVHARIDRSRCAIRRAAVKRSQDADPWQEILQAAQAGYIPCQCGWQ